MEQNQINRIKKIAEEFFLKMTMPASEIEADFSSVKKEFEEKNKPNEKPAEVVDLNIKLEEPQILIGQGGQTLFEIQRILRMILNKRLQSFFYLNFDINDYKKKKVEYLKNLAKDLADEVSLTKKEKALSSMPAYERRIIHAELSQRTDVVTESEGEGQDRHIVIKAK